MSREIRFRVWHSQLNKVLDHDWLVSAGVLYSAINKPEEGQIVMQSTEYKDASGIIIYDGDLLSLSETKYTYEVRWENGAWVCHHWNSDYGRWGPLSRFFDPDFSKYYVNIIGNIHENPKAS